MTPTTIGRYEIRDTLGEGAMGTVYLAYDPVIQREVAIKTIRVDQIRNPAEREEFRKRFFVEAQIGGRLQHPGIVVLHDVGVANDLPFIVMEHIAGTVVADLIKGGDRLSGELMCKILQQTGEALTYAHELGVIHRDIKPQNLMLTPKQQIKVLDFGIAKLVGLDITVEGEFLGTPSYSSPEQVTNQGVDYRSDIFSFGVLAHKLLTGYDPFPGKSLKNIFYQIVYGDACIEHPLTYLQLDSVHMEAVFRRALHKNPAKRFQSAVALAEALLALFSKTQIPPATAGPVANSQADTQTLRPGQPPVIEEVRLKEKKIRLMRVRFNESLVEENAVGCRGLLRALERRGVNTVSEKQKLLLLEQSLEEKRREMEITQAREQFKNLIDADDLSGAHTVLQTLISLKADPSQETHILTRKQLKRDWQIEKEREAFEKTLKGRDLIRARTHFRHLQALGGQTEDQKIALAQLEQQQMAQAKMKLKDISSLREAFQLAISNKSLVEAEKAMAQLEQTQIPMRSEHSAMANLKKDLERGHQQELLLEKSAFSKALKQRELKEAARILDRLTLLAPNDEELPVMGGRLVKAVNRYRVEQMAQLERDFEHALDEGDAPKARQAQEALAALGAESPLYKWLLARAVGKDPGPRPRQAYSAFRMLLIGGLLGLLILFIWWLISPF